MTKTTIEDTITKRMAQRGISNREIDFFLAARRSVDAGAEKINWNDIQPVAGDSVPDLPGKGSREYEAFNKVGRQHLGKCAVVKLNGGRSTSMGGQVPKCGVAAKDGMSFLDIVMRQVVATNDRIGVEVPLVLMNSFFTDQVTEKIVGKTPLIVMNFMQNEYLRIRQDNLHPLETGDEADWCPAGHGNFYESFYSSGLVDGLLDLGIRYAFVSNIDNLSAELSPVILGMMVTEKHDFLMEVTAKTTEDVKGGAPVFHRGQMSLLEIAQVPEEHHDDFQDIERFQYFNTNNLWVDLLSLKKLIETNRLKLPVIENRKTINDTEVIQIETAMGAALGSFCQPGLLNVPRSRFAPVKKFSDLEHLQSDQFALDSQYRIRRKKEQPCSLEE